MVKDGYNQDENDLEDFEDFKEFYGLKNDEEDEPCELDFNNPDKKLRSDSLDGEETEETDI